MILFFLFFKSYFSNGIYSVFSLEKYSSSVKFLLLQKFIIFALVAYAILQIRLFGMKVKDFWTFIEANQMLDKLYKFANQYENMSPQEQVIYLSEAEKIFNAFDKVPDELWEEEYDKYKEVLTKYKDIKMLRWASTSNQK